jgi:hypothetical protein
MEELTTVAVPRERYASWLKRAERERDLLALRRIPFLIVRDKEKNQPEMFEASIERLEEVPSDDKEAARLFICRDFRLPYYYGPTTFARLGSYNVDQFLVLCGDLFEQVLASITLRRKQLRLERRRQEQVIRTASEELWKSIPQRIPYGRDVQILLTAVAKMSEKETFRAGASYAPGVTGTAMSMADRTRLMDPTFRSKNEGAARLFNALASAIAHNLLEVELDKSVKKKRWMVLYLNRLLCPVYRLPLQRGSFRERKLDELVRWTIPPPVTPSEPAGQRNLFQGEDPQG